MNIKYLPRIILLAFLFFEFLGCKENSEKKISEPEERAETFNRNNQITEYALLKDSLISKPIKGGDLFVFNFEVSKNQFIHIVAEQKEIDFKLTLKRPESDSLIVFDTPNGQRGNEAVYFISQQSGKHQLNLEPFSDFAEPAGFNIVLKTIRNATELDRNWMQLYERMNEANQLRGNRETRAKAVQEFNKIIPLWSKMGDKFQEAVARRSLGYTLRSMGKKEEAIHTFESVLPLWRDLGEIRYEAFTYLILAGIYKSEKNYDKAIPLTQKAIEKWIEAGDKVQESRAYSDLASFYMAKGEMDTAKDYYQKSIKKAEESGSLSVQGIMLREYGNAWQTFGDDKMVIDYYTQALDTYKKLGHPTATALVYRMLGDFLYNKGQMDKSKSYFEEALKIYELEKDSVMATFMKNKLNSI